VFKISKIFGEVPSWFIAWILLWCSKQSQSFS